MSTDVGQGLLWLYLSPRWRVDARRPVWRWFPENGEWHQVFSYRQMMEQCQEEGKLEGVLKARWHEFVDEDDD